MTEQTINRVVRVVCAARIAFFILGLVAIFRMVLE